MTIGPEQRNADFNSQQAAYQKNADMRKGWATGDYEQTIEAHHRRLNAENIDLRGQLDAAQKARMATWELLEAERVKVAKFETEREYLLTDNRENKSAKYRLMSALDQEKLLRVNDAATIADLERRLREAEGQLKAQRLSAENVAEIRAYVPYGDRVARAENVELRRTIKMMAKTAAEVQDNFRLIAELAADPADEKRKEPKP